MKQIPESHIDLLTQPVYITLSTLMPNGQPQSSVVWCSYEDGYVLLNTAKGRQKHKNMNERPMATILAIDPENPYRYLEVRGTVDEITETGANDHIDQLAQLYVGKEHYYGDFAPAEMADKETRIICKLKPTNVVALNLGG